MDARPRPSGTGVDSDSTSVVVPRANFGIAMSIFSNFGCREAPQLKDMSSYKTCFMVLRLLPAKVFTDRSLRLCNKCGLRNKVESNFEFSDLWRSLDSREIFEGFFELEFFSKEVK